MTAGFTADWLALREPADRAARDPGLVAALRDALGPDPASIVDLGCGTGSNLRALAPHLGPRQSWRLVDHDADLLARAREAVAGWAESADPTATGGVVVMQGERRIAVEFAAVDLAGGLDAALGPRPDLVTAAALFDLFSVAAIEALAEAVAARGAVFYTALTYDGGETWNPPHPADAAIHAAFLAHMAADKGLGPAAGPKAPEALASAFRRRGYAVRTAPSPWRLGASDAALMRELARGKADAAAETGRVAEADLASWRAARTDGPAEGRSALVGHLDLLALPG